MSKPANRTRSGAGSGASKASTKRAEKAPAKTVVAAKAAKPRKAAPSPQDREAGEPLLLSGGNPQIAKDYGDAPVQAYIAAMPGWKSEVGRRLDALVERTVPGVHKAVKWNSPLYGMDGRSWFLGVHCYAKYIKLAFFCGAALRPIPPVASKTAQTRYVHLHEDEPLDEAQLAAWIKQASELPGERM